MANEIILKNVKLRWAYLDKPQTNGEFASNKYQVDVVLDEASKKAEAAGYEVKSGVSKGLTYLVTNTPDSGSSKNKKAQQLGTKVITEEDFLKLVNNVENDLNFL